MAEAICGNCTFWTAPRALSENVKPSVAEIYHLDRGNCHRFPEVLSKLASESCGEHPARQQQRDAELAGKIAAALQPRSIVDASPKETAAELRRLDRKGGRR